MKLITNIKNMNMKYRRTFVKRLFLILSKKFKAIGYNKMIKNLQGNQIIIFDKIIDISKNNRDCIRFDPISSEIIIVLPKILITISGQKINIHNSTGFLTQEMTGESIEYIKNIIMIEAHRERRRLKHEAIKRISEFITNIES